MTKIKTMFSIGASFFNVQNLNNDELIIHCKERYSNIKYKNFDDKVLDNLKNVFLDEGKNYIKQILETDENLSLKIDSIWGNVNVDNAIEVPHNHRTSLVSAVYYLTKGKITFLNPYQAALAHIYKKDIDSYNHYNCDLWTCEMIPGDMIIFNSQIQHYVEKVDSERISIACDMSLKSKRINHHD